MVQQSLPLAHACIASLALRDCMMCRLGTPSSLQHCLLPAGAVAHGGGGGLGNEKGMLGGLKIKERAERGGRDLPVNGLFFAIGHEPASAFLAGQVTADCKAGAALHAAELGASVQRTLWLVQLQSCHAEMHCHVPVVMQGRQQLQSSCSHCMTAGMGTDSHVPTRSHKVDAHGGLIGAQLETDAGWVRGDEAGHDRDERAGRVCGGRCAGQEVAPGHHGRRHRHASQHPVPFQCHR